MVVLTPAQLTQVKKMLVTIEAMMSRNEQLIAMIDRRERIPENMLKPIRI